MMSFPFTTFFLAFLFLPCSKCVSLDTLLLQALSMSLRNFPSSSVETMARKRLKSKRSFVQRQSLKLQKEGQKNEEKYSSSSNNSQRKSISNNKKEVERDIISNKNIDPMMRSSPRELIDFAYKTNVRKQYGSLKYQAAWKRWILCSINAIRAELEQNLPHPVDRIPYENLSFRLGVAADHGIMPSFSDPGARSGYALDFFCRARNLAELLLDKDNSSFPSYWSKAIAEPSQLFGSKISKNDLKKNQDYESTNSNITPDETFKMVSLGGGPGYDFVAAALVSTFFHSTLRKKSIHATIFDYEEGWKDLVESMNTATKNVLEISDGDKNNGKLSCDWGGKCDITKPLSHPHNSVAFGHGIQNKNDIIKETKLWTCQYCIAENAQQLRDSNYIFFKDLFGAVPNGTLFIFTETTPHLWPDFYNIVEEHDYSMEIGFPAKRGYQMVLRKKTKEPMKTNNEGGTTIVHDNNSEDEDKNHILLKEFQEISKIRKMKLQKGWKRQEVKKYGLIADNR